MITKIIKVDATKPSQIDIDEAADIIRGGGLVVFPTETVYGIGADATNESATARIYAAKGRPSDNPLIIHIAAPSDADKYAFTNNAYYSLAERFMPGPITIILKARDTVPLTTRGGLETVAVRCPSNVIAGALIRSAGVPIAAPSANLSGSPSPTSPEHVIDDMNGRVELILDGGDCDFGLESTIISIDGDKDVTLLRPGKITVSDISALGFNVRVASAVTHSLSDGEKALSPGMKYKHYAPKAPLILIDGDVSCVIDAISRDESARIAIIAYSEDISAFKEAIPAASVYDFGSVANQTEQAHLLFKLLRDTDKADYDVIYAPIPNADGIGLALYNRMIRAAAHKIIRL